MIAITTSNSIKVNAAGLGLLGVTLMPNDQ
jgi:hypothetical protein